MGFARADISAVPSTGRPPELSIEERNDSPPRIVASWTHINTREAVETDFLLPPRLFRADREKCDRVAFYAISEEEASST